jgi:plasmid stabilization system protein ParE
MAARAAPGHYMQPNRQTKRHVRIGCAAGFWGDTETAAPQLLKGGALDYLVLDYLAEITMSIMAGARLRGEGGGYATDFVSRVMRGCLADALQQRVRIVTNAGGVNPLACREALRVLAGELGVSPKVALVLGDDLMSIREQLAQQGAVEMFSGAPLPASLLSANAYFGAKPIADALAAGADIVITGRVVDSALALGPLVYEFGWGFDDFDRLAQGSLAGHIIECGAQATGGLFTDWEAVPGYEDMGYPIVECADDGSFVLSKPEGTGGLVTPAVVYEQLVYEIGDPRAYVLPDVVCDFTQVHAEQVGPNRVRVTGAKGRAPTPSYKVSATYPDGYKVAAGILLAGEDAARKAERVAKALVDKIERLIVSRGLGPFRATQIDVLGAEATYGPHARAQAHNAREVVVRIAVSHAERDALKLFTRELPQAGTSMAPGFASLVGGLPQPASIVRLFSFLIDKTRVIPEIDLDGERKTVSLPDVSSPPAQPCIEPERSRPVIVTTHRLPLIALAYGRSGDKGDHSNIGILAREARFAPYIDAALTADAVARYLAHLLDPTSGRVIRYTLPGCHGWNFLLENSLGGGGVASLRADPQGKAHAQQLLAFEVPVPEAIYDELQARQQRRGAP